MSVSSFIVFGFARWLSRWFPFSFAFGVVSCRMCVLHWHVVYVCDVFCVCFWLPKTERVLKVRTSSFACAQTYTLPTYVHRAKENIKNVENTEIEYVGGFKQHYAVASIGFSVKVKCFLFRHFSVGAKRRRLGQ